MRYIKQFMEQVGKFVNVDYKIIIKDHKTDQPTTLITDFKIITTENSKSIIKGKGYIISDLNNDYKKKKGWIEFDDFKDNKTRTIWNKNFENGSKKIKVYV